ncbi:hypothetical protein NQZ68_040749 [Dissostichus eleginoides]|nr:hypothetical protein NQZ68_040749 [Dissostichus eleginoides]
MMLMFSSFRISPGSFEVLAGCEDDFKYLFPRDFSAELQAVHLQIFQKVKTNSVPAIGLVGSHGKYELDWSEAGDSCNDKGHGVAVPASEPANAAHRPLLTLGLKD